MAKHIRIGKKGEDEAIAFLQKQGYTILHTNWRYQHLEIDIIAEYKSIICIVEVKTRTIGSKEDIPDWITPKKIKNLVHAAEQYLQQTTSNAEVRFDIIGILQQPFLQIIHIKEAFYGSDVS